jgi:hypothetical protein
MATKCVSCPVPSLAMKQASVESSGRRPDAKDVASAMPVVNGKATARIRAIFFMAISWRRARTSAKPLTFWSFFKGCGERLGA